MFAGRETYVDISRDPREEETWFRRLPVAEQARLRVAWRRERARSDPWRLRARSMSGRCVREGLLTLLVPALMVGGWPLVLGAVPAGAGLGLLWARWRTGRIRSGLTAAMAMTVLVLGTGFLASRSDLTGLFSMLAVVLAGLLGAVLGLRRELCRREQAL